MQNKAHQRRKAALKRGYRRNSSARYPIENSPLWGLKSLHRLTQLLRVNEHQLKKLAEAGTYNIFLDTSKPSKPRWIQEPTGSTMDVHYRLAKLLDSIHRPDFLHSATKKRSNVSNALAHADGHAIVKTDIHKFYESTTYQHIKSFFFNELGWSHDLARLMANVCTVNGHLPTGSGLSPLMSYYAHRKTFLEIGDICDACGVAMTLYVDDLTLSGVHATKSLLLKVKTKLANLGLITHKEEYVAPGRFGIITGVAVGNGQTKLRNLQHKNIVAMIDTATSGRVDALNSLTGKLAAAKAVEPAAATKLLDRLHRRRASPEYEVDQTNVLGGGASES